jgi:ABC-type transport system involved in multi-copper enzyme maturation permease subunit
MQILAGATASDIWRTVLAMVAWSVAFFAIGVWRFNSRYA